MSNDVQTIGEVLNLSQAMDNLAGDAELLQEIMEVFMSTAPTQLQNIAANIEMDDCTAVATEAHGMKGGAANFCAKRFVKAALTLEMRAKKGNLDGAGDLLQEMRDSYQELEDLAKVINWDEVAANWED